VRVADDGLRDAEARRDVRLRERAGDAVRIGMAAEREEKSLSFGRAERFGEGLGALESLCWRHGESTNGFGHRSRIVDPFGTQRRVYAVGAKSCIERASARIFTYLVWNPV